MAARPAEERDPRRGHSAFSVVGRAPVRGLRPRRAVVLAGVAVVARVGELPALGVASVAGVFRGTGIAGAALRVLARLLPAAAQLGVAPVALVLAGGGGIAPAAGVAVSAVSVSVAVRGRVGVVLAVRRLQGARRPRCPG